MELRFPFFFCLPCVAPLAHLYLRHLHLPRPDGLIYLPRQSSLMTLTLILVTNITILMNPRFSLAEPLLLISKRRDSNLEFEFRKFLLLIDALHHIELSIIFTACVCTLESTRDEFTRPPADAFVGSRCTLLAVLIPSHKVFYISLPS